MRIESLTPHDVKEVTRSLQDMLGEGNAFGLLHVAVEARNTSQLMEWIRGDSLPSEDQLERLVFIHEVMVAVQNCKGTSSARHWFLDHRCQDGSMVYDAVRVCNYDVVRNSVNELGANLNV